MKSVRLKDTINTNTQQYQPANRRERWLLPAFKALLTTSIKLPSQLPFRLSQLRAGMLVSSRLVAKLEPKGQTPWTQTEFAGLSCEVHGTWPERNAAGVVLYLHGGAFFAGSPETHRGLCARLSQLSGYTVIVPDYRLAPEHPFPAACEDSLAVYQGLLAAGYAPEAVRVAGDSAGGALSLLLAQHLKAHQLPLPKALMLVSPWVDLSLTLPTVRHNAQADPMLTRDALNRGGEAFAGPLSLNDARVSALRGDLDGLPPVLIQVGSEEILLDDSRQLAQRLGQAGTEVRLEVYQGFWHDFQLFAHWLPTARLAVQRLADWQRAKP